MLKQNSEQTQSSEKEEEPKTRQEIEKERISHLVDLSCGLSRSRAVQSSQIKAEGEARVLESEIKMDKERTGETEFTAKKEEKLAKLQQRAADLPAKIAAERRP